MTQTPTALQTPRGSSPASACIWLCPRGGGPVAPPSAETGEPDGVTSDLLSTELRSLLIFLPRLSQVLNVPREALGPKYVTQVATTLPRGGGGRPPYQRATEAQVRRRAGSRRPRVDSAVAHDFPASLSWASEFQREETGVPSPQGQTEVSNPPV